MVINNPWVVGIGVTVIGGLILYYVFGVGRTKQDPDEDKTYKDSFNKSSLAKLTPKKIFEEIEKSPVYQQGEIAKSFKGIKVIDWITTLSSARKIQGGMIHLMLLYRGSYPWVYATVSENIYPELKIMKKIKKL